MKKVMILGAMLLMLSGCMATKTTVGDYKAYPGKTYTHARGKQLFLFWGLLPLGRTNTNTPQNNRCEVITKYAFEDIVLSAITGGIISAKTVKVKGKK